MAKKYSQSLIEEIKARVSLLDVIRASSVTGWKRKGKDWWACCPFHHEKTPSFHIKEDAGFYHCFGCGAHGNVFDFIVETQGGSFGEAVRSLSERAGLKIELQEESPEVAKRRNDGFAVLERTAGLWQKNLRGAPLAYFQRRGLSAETMQTFRLGYSLDDWQGLSNVLLNEGFSPQILRETGLTIEGKRQGDYDRFRDRVMFPIERHDGKVVAYGGRTLGDGEPKYLNSPETPFFNKREVLYNLNRAREAVRKVGTALVVEGYMDVIALWQHGVEYAVAPLGTALTETQIQLLWRYADTPIVCMDGDTAGRTAAVRAAQRILPHLKAGKGLSFVYLPEKEDPDSYVNRVGKEGFEEFLQNKVSLEEVLWQELVSGKNIADADARASIEAEIYRLTEEMQDPLVKKAYASTLKNKFWQAVRGTNRGSGGSKWEQKKSASQKPKVAEGKSARLLLSILFRKPELINEFYELLGSISFENEEDRTLQSLLFDFFAAGGVEKEKLDTYLNRIGSFGETKMLFTSDVVERMKSEDLRQRWLEEYQALKDSEEARKELTHEDLFNPESWKKLKQGRMANKASSDTLKQVG